MKTDYNNQKITSYLLGVLPEEEAEHFDELSFTDDEFAVKLKLVETDLVDEYLSGELRGSTLAQFKTFYLASPLRSEKVEFAKSFREFAEKELKTPEISDKSKIAEIENKPTRKFSRIFSFLNIFPMPIPAVQLGFAFLLLFSAGLIGWLLFENSRLKDQYAEIDARRIELQEREKMLQDSINGNQSSDLEKDKQLLETRAELARLEKELEKKRETDQKQLPKQTPETEIVRSQKPVPRLPVIASFILTPQLRGNSQLQTLPIPKKTDSISMRLELESDDFPIYLVALKNQADGAILWRSGKIRSNSRNKTLNTSLPASLLKSQNYSLQVSGIASTGEAEIVGEYSFRVVR
jgi:hypothetical protein